jgi:uncharacterized protein YodC (DUF2158 family)
VSAFKIGDVVRLKSGSCNMTIELIGPVASEYFPDRPVLREGFVRVVYWGSVVSALLMFSSGRAQDCIRQVLHEDMIELVNPGAGELS